MRQQLADLSNTFAAFAKLGAAVLTDVGNFLEARR
jgi:hypothetical protein